MYNRNHVHGEEKGKIVLYALSTCVWCKKTRNLLDDLGVAYDYIYVDTLSSEENRAAKEDMKQWNPQGSFPTIVVNDTICIVGFDADRIKKELGS
ncbi:MAG TPA: glutaredoxin family protein [Spirochaetes bacterium]|nr:glutaredoxin family protein [Spirochaetota bacterium]